MWGATEEQERLAKLNEISIHAPRVGSDGRPHRVSHRGEDFNPRSPCGERRKFADIPDLMKQFQSTLPVWGATSSKLMSNRSSGISIHAPRVGSDPSASSLDLMSRHFNPRSPCGERLRGLAADGGVYRFQSTLPVWGATLSTVPPSWSIF